jgi:hypothetical protein
MSVTLEGFLVGFKFERNRKAGDGKDNDLHLEIAPCKNWNTRHVVAEIKRTAKRRIQCGGFSRRTGVPGTAAETAIFSTT